MNAPLYKLLQHSLLFVALCLLLTRSGRSFVTPSAPYSVVRSRSSYDGNSDAYVTLPNLNLAQGMLPVRLFSSRAIDVSLHVTDEQDAVSNDVSSSTHPSITSFQSLRHSLRALTGFSLTAVRATLRAMTGLSVSAVYASTVAATSGWIRCGMKLALDVFPTWLRYFVQPILILYYVPLYAIRRWTRHDNQGAAAARVHRHVVDGWKATVARADNGTPYWPVHVRDNGIIESDLAEVDVNQGIAESIEVVYSEEHHDDVGLVPPAAAASQEQHPTSR